MTKLPKLPGLPKLPSIGGEKRPSGWAAYDAKKKLMPKAISIPKRYGVK